MDLLFANYVTSNRDAFLKKVVDIAGRLGINPNWLMAVMYKESRLNHTAVNPKGGATGLIQFMPDTATWLGTTTAILRQMSNVEQLDWVEKYFRPYRGKIKSYVDMYLATFFPTAMGKPDEWVIQSSKLSANKIALNNLGIDLDKSGDITVGEFARYCYKGFSQAIIDILKKNLL